MEISLIVAVAENGVIGRNNELPWRLSSDLKRFRCLTMGKPMIMGRRTFQSIGKVLDGRDNIIVTRDPSLKIEGAYVVNSVDEALEIGLARAKIAGADEIMMIGGAELYRLFLPVATSIYYTLVHAEPEGDATFPTLNMAEWQEISRDDFKASAADSNDYSYIYYKKT